MYGARFRLMRWAKEQTLSSSTRLKQFFLAHRACSVRQQTVSLTVALFKRGRRLQRTSWAA
eukprot:6049994-Alexandrium_andersonii.AAC.1